MFLIEFIEQAPQIRLLIFEQSRIYNDRIV